MKTKLFIMLIALLVFSGNNNVNAQQRVRKPQKRTAVKKSVSKQTHQAIDLGLPSGTKWASCNVGANKPEEYGDYYAWGETTTKKEYTVENYRFRNIVADVSGTQYDVARAKWGGKWRMPTNDEVNELVDNCKYERTTLNGVIGGKFTGPNGNSIFLPAACFRYRGDLINYIGEFGNYWSSALVPDDSDNAFGLAFDSKGARWDGNLRLFGRSVRPVISSDNENKQIKDRTTSSQSKTTPSQTQPKTTTSRAYTSCPDNNHPHIIDLGLPSGTKWACCNVDAKKPEDYGGYYAWGETSTKTEYSSSNYRYDQVNLGNDISGTQYDVAHVKWGGKWQMPTVDKVKELIDNCKYEWTTLNGVKGYMFTGNNGKSIFIPAAGVRYYGSMGHAGLGVQGHYWLSTQYSSDIERAFKLFFRADDVNRYDDNDRSAGQSIRPVISSDNENKQIKDRTTSSQSKTTSSQTQPKTTTSRAYTSCPDNNHPHIIDLGLPSGTKWACCNVDANKPEDYGGYYAWGETSTKTEYSSSNYRYDQVNLGNDISGTQYDVAHVKWGGKWQMPTQEQIKELDDNCKYEWTTMSGVKGGKFTGPNGGSIFLPAAGYPNLLVGENGFYWSSTQSPSYSICAYHLYFYSGDADWGDDGTRRSDRSVRPVARN